MKQQTLVQIALYVHWSVAELLGMLRLGSETYFTFRNPTSDLGSLNPTSLRGMMVKITECLALFFCMLYSSVLLKVGS